MKPIERCPWCGTDPLYVAYHDQEWGVPQHGEREIFEFLVLEAAQAGLSWLTVLRKRENYRRCFAGYDVERIAAWGEKEVAALMQDAGLVRNRLKIESALHNARATLRLYEAGWTLDRLFWQFVDGRPVTNHRRGLSDLPAETPTSRALSNELKRRGFRFVGPTVMYAHMQATGMVNDHLTGCPRHAALAALADLG